MTQERSVRTWALVATLASVGCDPSACIRQSDCPEGLVCNAELVCVAQPTDDGGADAGQDAGASVRVDLGRGPMACTEALRCEVFQAYLERAKACEGALAPAEVAAVRSELECVIAGCPQACAHKLNDVELADPASCWTCAASKLGGLCVVQCQ